MFRRRSLRFASPGLAGHDTLDEGHDLLLDGAVWAVKVTNAGLLFLGDGGVQILLN